MYVLGIDAGGTKTSCVVADRSGAFLGEGHGGEANHQVCGITVTKASLKAAMDEALAAAKISLAEICYAVLGMSGADGEDDFEVLIPAVESLMNGIPFEIVHDAWLGFRAATKEKLGVVSICGTGAGHAGQNRQGEKLTLRNLDYPVGNLGGGGGLAESALHYAFRSNEGTWEKTAMEGKVPPIFGVNTMDEVCLLLKKQGLGREQAFRLPVMVFETAREGDPVARMLISDMGRELGRYAAALIRRLHMTKERVPMVLIGSLFRTGEPLLVDAYMEEVHRAAAQAYAVIPDAAPVAGAVGLALDYVREMEAGCAQEK